MADEDTTNEPSDEVPEPATGGSGLSKMMGKLGPAERLLTLGAAIVVADYLLFEVILEEYSFFTGTLLVAGYVLFAVWVRHSRPSASWPVPYGWLLRLLGITAGFLGLVELLADLRLGILDDAGDVLGGLILYAGVVLMSWGGLQMKEAGGS